MKTGRKIRIAKHSVAFMLVTGLAALFLLSVLVTTGQATADNVTDPSNDVLLDDGMTNTTTSYPGRDIIALDHSTQNITVTYGANFDEDSLTTIQITFHTAGNPSNELYRVEYSGPDFYLFRLSDTTNWDGAAFTMGAPVTVGGIYYDEIMIQIPAGAFTVDASVDWWAYSETGDGSSQYKDFCPDSYDPNYVPPPSAPPAPASPILQDISPNSNTNGSFTLDWNDVSGATSYTVYQYSSLITTVNSSLTTVGTVSPSEYNVTGLKSGKYYFAVVAENSGGSSPLSNCVNVTVSISTATATESMTSGTVVGVGAAGGVVGAVAVVQVARTGAIVSSSAASSVSSSASSSASSASSRASDAAKVQPSAQPATVFLQVIEEVKQSVQAVKDLWDKIPPEVKAKIKDKVNELYLKLNKDARFTLLAAKYVDCHYAAQKGDTKKAVAGCIDILEMTRKDSYFQHLDGETRLLAKEVLEGSLSNESKVSAGSESTGGASE